MIRRLLTALVLLTATAAFTSVPSGHHDYVLAAVSSIPATKADRAGERAERRASLVLQFAEAIADVSARRQNPRQYAALLTTILERESHVDTEVIAGRCRPRMCDSTIIKGVEVFRAKGGFQGHDFPLVHDLWVKADDDARVQTEMADRVLSRSLTRCAKDAPFPAHVFRAYRGGSAGSCTIALADEKARVATFERLLRVAVKP